MKEENKRAWQSFLGIFKKNEEPKSEKSAAESQVDSYMLSRAEERLFTQSEVEKLLGIAYNAGVDDGMEGVPQEVYDKAYFNSAGLNTAHLEWFSERWSKIKEEILKIDFKYF